MLSFAACRHEGAGPCSVSVILCRSGSVNLILTWIRPRTRAVPACAAGERGRARCPSPAPAAPDPDGDAPAEFEPPPNQPPGVVGGGSGETLWAESGRSGVGTGAGAGTAGARTVGAGAVGVVGVGAGTVGAGTVGVGTVGTGTLGAGTVGAGGRLGVVTTAVVIGVETVGRASAGLVAATDCATRTPKAGRATRARAASPRISPQMPHTRG
jgi:hypothetical protein